MQAVILAGGLGTRLASTVPNIPKSMASINNKPFIDYQIDLLTNNGFDNFLLLTGHLSEVIEDYFSNNSSVKCVRESKPFGTGGSILNAYPLLEDEFFVINGDTFFDIDFSVIHDFAIDKESVLALRYSTDIARYGFVDINSKFQVQQFIEKGCLPSNCIDGYINGGVYYFKKRVLDSLYKNFKSTAISLEKEIFPLLIDNKILHGLPCGGGFIDIGIPDDYYRAQTYIPEILKQPKFPAVFVDKDGTLIDDLGYTHGANISIIESTYHLLQKYASKGYLLIIVTNQSGIAKGKFSVDDMFQNIDAIQKYYEQYGMHFHDIQYCPYHLESIFPKYNFISKARKPEAGMILRACENFRIDLKQSVMIGNNPLVDKIKLPYLKTIIIGEKNV